MSQLGLYIFQLSTCHTTRPRERTYVTNLRVLKIKQVSFDKHPCKTNNFLKWKLRVAAIRALAYKSVNCIVCELFSIEAIF